LVISSPLRSKQAHLAPEAETTENTRTQQFGLAMTRVRSERRRGNRVRLSSPVVGRIASYGAVILDVSEGGARVEHYTRLQTGQITSLRFEFDGRVVNTECEVMSCRVERFSTGDDGLTVYQSGVRWTHPDDGTGAKMKAISTTLVARALAEQVANAKGVKPLHNQNAMPIFRGEVMTSNTFDAIESEKNKHLIPISKLVKKRGFLCCSLVRGMHWTRKWTMNPEQPREGFTVSVREPVEQVEKLCETYMQADSEGRRLIRLMATISLDAERNED
jgi:hypothetical protein